MEKRNKQIQEGQMLPLDLHLCKRNFDMQIEIRFLDFALVGLISWYYLVLFDIIRKSYLQCNFFSF
jgi:hypothetical protein